MEELIKFMPGYVYWHDMNMAFLGCSGEEAALLGLSTQEIIGKTPYDFLSKEEADLIVNRNQEVIKAKKTMTFEEVVNFPDGKRRVYYSRKTPLFNKDNEIIGILGLSFDVTHEKTQ